jgi:hypothetical protein
LVLVLTVNEVATELVGEEFLSLKFI